MKKNTLFLIIILLSFHAGFSQVLTDSTITMIAFWGMDDQAVYEFKETEDKLSKGEKTLQESTYDVTMTVRDSTAEKYSMTWTYDNIKRNYELSPEEAQFMEICGDIPTNFRTDEFGSFETIENWKEMSEMADVGFEQWVASKKELPDSVSMKIKNMLTSMFSSEKQMNFWARDLLFFHYLYGVQLSRTEPFVGVKLYSNPFIQKVMEGREKVTVTAVDEENYIARIQTESGIDGDAAKAIMVDFLKKNMESLGIKDESEINLDEIPNFSVEEKIDCIYDIATGYILKGSYSKLTRLNEDYKLTTYEYKLKD